MDVTTKSSYIESYLLIHSNPPLSTIIPLPHHSSNWMRSLHVSSRIAVIQTNKQSSSSNPTVSIPPCKPKAASLNQCSVCHRALASRWIIPNKQTTETTKHYLPSLFVVWFPCGIQGFNIYTHIIPLSILSTFHTLQYQMKNWISHSHCFLSKQFHSSIHPTRKTFHSISLQQLYTA